MADIRCLICDHVNDESAERCWYCQAPLPGKSAVPVHDGNPVPQAEVPQQAEPEEPGTSIEEMDDPFVEEVPDWLIRIRKLKEQDAGTPLGEKEVPEEDQDIPQWLMNLKGMESDNLEVKPVEYPLREEYDLQVEQKGGLTGTSNEAAGELVEKLEATQEDGAVEKTIRPADLDEDTTGPGEAPVETAVTLPGDRRESGQKNTEVEDITTEPEKKPDEKAAPPIFVDDLPEWLNAEKDVIEKITSPPPDSQQKHSEPAGGKLEKGLLPAWLKVLRPLDAVQPAVPQQAQQAPVEEHGVLAGIEGTLRAVDLSSRENKPSSFQQKLQVTPAHLRNAELFRNLLQTEPPAGAAKPTDQLLRGRNRLMRVVIAVILLLSIFLPFLVRSANAVIPVLYPQEVVDTLILINELPAEKPVLVAAQFEPGLAGELAWAAEPVIEHLVSRGIPMAVTSTNVTGYAILQDQLNKAAEVAVNYPVDEKIVNLGYLPGGTIGLISLVNDLQRTMPLSTDLAPAWELPAIQSVNEFSGFGAILILTDNPETARSWVEQAGRAVSPPPLLAVVSAQVAPLIQPYYDSNQITGYVAGANGALTYELIRQVPGKAASAYSSYQWALLTTALLVFVGGMVTLIISSVAETKKKG